MIKIRKLTLLVFGCFLASVCGAQKPNVIFILSDDLGWGDLQCYGNPYVETPSINRLASEGVRFTDYYSPSPLCAPARAAILTGRYNHRTGAVDVSSNMGIDRIALSERTMGDYFRHAGYATALIGKWHNGIYSDPYLPHHRGFDLFFGFPNGGQDYYQYNLMRNGVYEKNDGRYMTNVLNTEAIRFVEEHRDKPFFLFLSHHAPHVPFQAPDSLIEKYRRRIGNRLPLQDAVLYAMIEVMDRGIGELINKLEELKIGEDTIIVFTSDNGAQYSNRQFPRFQGPFSGEKGYVMEQGIRVPAILRWKGKIKPQQIISTPVHGCDWLPSLFSLTGVAPPAGAKPLDGRDVITLLRNQDISTLEARQIFFQKNRYTPVRHSDGSMRMGEWKIYWPMVEKTMKKDIGRDNASYEKGLVERHWEMPLDTALPRYDDLPPSVPQLFHLKYDPSERHDVAARYPERVREMAKAYDLWFDEMEIEWEQAWDEIKRQEYSYWNKKPKPDPRKLFMGFWRWDTVEGGETDPLTKFKGYWSTGNTKK